MTLSLFLRPIVFAMLSPASVARVFGARYRAIPALPATVRTEPLRCASDRLIAARRATADLLGCRRITPVRTRRHRMAGAQITPEVREALYDTLRRYVWCMDTGDIKGVVGCFTPDAEL